jgi:hypothetical protein
MAATRQPGRRASDAHAERFEKARLQLSRLHGGAGASLQEMWLGPQRRWSEVEADFACAIADNIARPYVELQQSDTEATLQT